MVVEPASMHLQNETQHMVPQFIVEAGFIIEALEQQIYAKGCLVDNLRQHGFLVVSSPAFLLVDGHNNVLEVLEQSFVANLHNLSDSLVDLYLFLLVGEIAIILQELHHEV